MFDGFTDESLSHFLVNKQQIESSAMAKGIRSVFFYALVLNSIILPSHANNNIDGNAVSDMVDTGKVLQELIDKHDKKVRANVGGPAVDLRLHLIILSIRAISEVDMSYTMTAYFNQFWNDTRMQHNLTSHITVDSSVFTSAFWIPHIYVANSCEKEIVHRSPRQNSVLYIFPDGRLLHSIRMTMTSTCDMDLRDYPFDEQMCGFEIGTYGYNQDEVILGWYNLNGTVPIITNMMDNDLPQFLLTNWSTGSRKQRYYDVGVVDYISAAFHLEREIAFHVLDSFIPSGCLALLASFTLWMPPTSPPARVTMGITCMLTLITKSALVRGDIPKVTYVTAIDIWYIFLELLVFLVLTEFAFVYYFYLKGVRYEEEKAKSKAGEAKCGKQPIFSVGDIQKIKQHKENELVARENLIGCSSNTVKLAWEKRVRQTRKDKDENYYKWLSETLDRVSRVVYLSAFALFVTIYWVQYL